MLHTIEPNNHAEDVNIIDNCFSTAQYAVRAAVHGVLKVSPGTTVFFRD
jgi:hypothetical protein